MIDKKVIKLVAKVYKCEDYLDSVSNRRICSYDYDFERCLSTYHFPSTLKEKDILSLQESGYEINKIVHYQHDQVINDLKKLIMEHDLEAKVYHLFLKAIGTGLHRGLQPIISYLFALHVPEHRFEGFEGKNYDLNPCRICGVKEEIWQNDGKNLYDLYIGYCRIKGYVETLLDLQEVVTFKPIKASAEDILVFKKLMAAIENAPEKETPTELLNRISKEKILPNSNFISRIWLIRILAELGVIRNKLDADYSVINQFYPYHQVLAWTNILYQDAPNHRTEVNFPISAWRGTLGINHEIVEKILDKVKIE